MSYTFTEHTTNGSTQVFPFSFAGDDKGYFTANDLRVEIRDPVTSQWAVVSGWTLTGTNQVSFAVPPAAGVVSNNLRIRRVMDKDNPYATFQRGVALDMNKLDQTHRHLLYALQEVLDGFLPDGFFFKNDVNIGDNKIINLKAGTAPKDAANFTQVDAERIRNDQQDQTIAGLVSSWPTTGRLMEWSSVATQGQTNFTPGPAFTHAQVFINGVFQHRLDGAYTTSNNTIVFSEGLQAGDLVYILVGATV